MKFFNELKDLKYYINPITKDLLLKKFKDTNLSLESN